MIDLNTSRLLAARLCAASAAWLLSLIVYCAAAPLTNHAATLYVWQDSPSPGSAYGAWASAAHTIQDAVDAAQACDLVLVTNGVYASGGRAVGTNILANRVAVDKPITLQSVNGPQVTIVEGAQAPGGGNGDGAIRCVYLTNGAALSGFTLTNGATLTSGDYDLEQSGGGLWCESTNALVTNCTLTNNWAYNGGGGAYGGTLNNCTLTGNLDFYDGGGAAYSCTLNSCTLTGNPAGGAVSSTLNNCTVTGNSGSGAYSCTLNNCVLTGNQSGGAFGGTLNNCTVTGNSGSGTSFATLNNCIVTGNSGSWGGAYSCTLNNCVLTGNQSGGAFGGTLNNCTVTGNSGWGASSATLNNCIVYFNLGPNGGNYDASSTLNYCCTTPLPTNGVGNISADPQLASASHLSAESPCIGAGSAAYVSGTDIDGEAWANPPSIGCDEYHAGAVTGPLTVSLASLTNVAIGFPVGLTALIAGRTDLSVWDFGDGSVAVNEPYTTHTWTAPGVYLVGLWAYNEIYPEGVSATLKVHVAVDVHYVAGSSGNPVAPYTSWATAATNIQDAVDVAVPGATIFVTNGAYAPVSVSTPLTLQSINGPGVTTINGGGTARCVYLTNGAAMAGFTMTNGLSLGGGGGGVYCEYSAVVSNCVLTGNATGGGGGAFGGTLNNCTLTGNRASLYGGGGAYDAMLNNCILTSNWARSDNAGGLGGGAFRCTLNNCTLTGNWAEWATTHWGEFQPPGGEVSEGTLNNCIVYEAPDSYFPVYASVLNHCCTASLFAGNGNITNAPLFVDLAGGNLRLQSNSPCINAGDNTYVMTNSTDLDGNPRIVSGAVDIGAYEYQGAGSVISYAWLQQYGLPTDGSVDSVDLDGNGMNVYQDWVADLNPTNAASVLSLTILSNTPPVAVTFSSSAVRRYTLLSCSNLTPSSVWSPVPGQMDLPGSGAVLTLTDTNPPAPAFYRVSVRLP